jgi:beta-glucosidase/6-phospho-beta-glucosidase/beta-galactosidase
MGHYEHWREDLAIARDLGVQALRWGPPWYRVEPEEGNFDWRWTDEVLPYLVEEVGITPIIDLMHYGCPFWLEREFANEAYPEAVAAYAAAFARRYQGLVRWYTPLNEPLVNAIQCGKRGVWPPYRRGDQAYILLTLQLAKGIWRTVEALKEVDPQVVLVHVEAAGLTRAAIPEVESLAAEERQIPYLSLDLLTGKMDMNHPRFPWLLRHGASLHDLEEIARHPFRWDVLGLNFYPQWTTRELYLNKKGKLRSRLIEKEGNGFADMIAAYHARYGGPIMITETSAFGPTRERARWLDASLAAVKVLRGQGVPVLGYTWFPLFTMIHWRYRLGKRPLEEYRQELGLYTLAEPEASFRWRATPLVEKFRTYVQNPQEAIGTFTSLAVR